MLEERISVSLMWRQKNTNHKQVTRIMGGEQGNLFDNRVISVSLSFLLIFFFHFGLQGICSVFKVEN